MATEVLYEYFINSNTRELIMKQSWPNSPIKGMGPYFYNFKRRRIEDDVDLTGFVPIKEKKWDKLASLQLREYLAST